MKREPGFYWVRRRPASELVVALLMRPYGRTTGEEDWFSFVGEEGFDMGTEASEMHWVGERLVPPDPEREKRG